MGQRLSLLLPWYRFPPFTDKTIGGLSTTLWDNVQALSALGHRITVLVPSTQEEEYLEGSVSIKRSPLGEAVRLGGKIEPKDVRWLSEFDAVISVNNYGARALSHLRSHVRLVRQIHTLAADRPVMSYLPLRWGPLDYAKMLLQKRREEGWEMLLKGTPTICVSRYLQAKAVERGVEDESNTKYIPNGVDLNLFRKVGRSKEYDLLFVGRFQYSKGLDLLVHALGRLAAKGVEPTLCVAGPFTGAEQKHVLGLFGEKTDRVVFAGLIPHHKMAEMYAKASVAVVPSRYESFGLPALEAAACGLPVVATRVGGLTEVLDHQPHLLAEKPESVFLASKIEQALAADAESLRQAEERWLRKAQHYSLNHVAQSIAGSIEESCEN